MAEVIWNDLSSGRWKAVSAGSNPSGYVHPLALKALQEIDLPIEGLHSKSSEPFTNEPFDLVVTVCGNAKEACPTWPSAKQLLHWPFFDPADATGDESEQMEVFRKVRDEIRERIQSWLQSAEQ